MKDFFLILGLIIGLEGFFYGMMPRLARRLAAAVASRSDRSLRIMGLVSLIIAILIVAFARYW